MCYFLGINTSFPVSSLHPIVHHTANFVTTVVESVVTVASLLFCIMGLVAVEGLRHIDGQVRHLIGRPRLDDSIFEARVVIMLDSWKRRHILIYQYVHQLNAVFDICLLFEICHVFVFFISSSFFVINSVTSAGWSFRLFLFSYLLKELAILSAICLVVDTIKHEVIPFSSH